MNLSSSPFFCVSSKLNCVVSHDSFLVTLFFLCILQQRKKERDVILERRGHDAARLRTIDHAHG